MELKIEARNLDMRKGWLDKIEDEKAKLVRHYANLVLHLRVTIENTSNYKEGGHEVGIHGYECRGSQNPITRFLFANELENLPELKQKYHSILDKEPELFRSHGPRSGRQFYNQLRESDLHLIFGSLTYQISITASEDIFIDHFTEAMSGTIICAHDSRNCDPDYGLAVEIANIVPELVKIMHNRNIEVVTVSELLD